MFSKLLQTDFILQLRESFLVFFAHNMSKHIDLFNLSVQGPENHLLDLIISVHLYHSLVVFFPFDLLKQGQVLLVWALAEYLFLIQIEFGLGSVDVRCEILQSQRDVFSM